MCSYASRDGDEGTQGKIETQGHDWLRAKSPLPAGDGGAFHPQPVDREARFPGGLTSRRGADCPADRLCLTKPPKPGRYFQNAGKKVRSNTSTSNPSMKSVPNLRLFQKAMGAK